MVSYSCRTPHQHANTDDSDHPEPIFKKVSQMQVFQVGTVNLLVKDFAEKAILSYSPAQSENERGVRMAKVNVNNSDYYIKYGEWKQITVNGVILSLKFGNQTWTLPFSLKLNEFQLERYPGSMSPSSFASQITLIDEEKKY